MVERFAVHVVAVTDVLAHSGFGQVEVPRGNRFDKLLVAVRHSRLVLHQLEPTETHHAAEPHPAKFLDQAADLGPCAIALVQSLWTDGVLCAASQAGHLFRLVGLYDPQRLEAACRRALFYKKTDYLTIERILSDNLENLPLSPYADVNGQLSLWPLNLPF